MRSKIKCTGHNVCSEHDVHFRVLWYLKIVVSAHTFGSFHSIVSKLYTVILAGQERTHVHDFNNGGNDYATFHHHPVPSLLFKRSATKSLQFVLLLAKRMHVV